MLAVPGRLARILDAGWAAVLLPLGTGPDELGGQEPAWVGCWVRRWSSRVSGLGQGGVKLTSGQAALAGSLVGIVKVEWLT